MLQLLLMDMVVPPVYLLIAAAVDKSISSDGILFGYLFCGGGVEGIGWNHNLFGSLGVSSERTHVAAVS